MSHKAPVGRTVGSFVPQLTKKAMETYGFPAAAILTDWPAIAGPELASYTAPERLRWPQRAGSQNDEEQPWHGAQGATLVLRVEGPRALEMQHCTAQLIERVNAYFGFCAVTDIRLLQAPVTKSASKPGGERKQAPRLPVAATEIADDRLRDVLERLGGNVQQQNRQKRSAG